MSRLGDQMFLRCWMGIIKQQVSSYQVLIHNKHTRTQTVSKRMNANRISLNDVVSIEHLNESIQKSEKNML